LLSRGLVREPRRFEFDHDDLCGSRRRGVSACGLVEPRPSACGPREDSASSFQCGRDASEVKAGFECGIGFEKFNDLKVGDVIEVFAMERVAVSA